MFLTVKYSGKVKARARTNGSVQRKHVAIEEAAAPTVTSEAIFYPQGTIFAHDGTLQPVIFQTLSFKPTTWIMFLYISTAS